MEKFPPLIVELSVLFTVVNTVYYSFNYIVCSNFVFYLNIYVFIAFSHNLNN